MILDILFAFLWFLIVVISIVAVGVVIAMLTEAVSNNLSSRRKAKVALKWEKAGTEKIAAYYWARGMLESAARDIDVEAVAGQFSSSITKYSQLDDMGAAFDEWLNANYLEKTVSRHELFEYLPKKK